MTPPQAEMGNNKSSMGPMPPDVRILHVAVMKNEVSTVEALIEAGIDLNYPWQSAEPPSIKDGSTPLCEAVSLNHKQIVKVLLSAGAYVNKPDSFGCTPLHKAAYHGRVALSEILILSGADLHLHDHNLNTPLHICVQNALVHNSVDTVKTIIKAGARVNEPNRFGKIALHYAALWGLEEITDVLIKAHSSIDGVDLNWKTPLYCCIRSINVLQRKRQVFQQHVPTIKVLVLSGCDPLNLASWITKHQILSPTYRINEDFYQWYVSSQPECLKQLCRQAIQRYMHYNEENTIANIRKLPLPNTLKDYLVRRLL